MLYQKLARQEGLVTLWDLPDIELIKAQYNYPIDYVIPRSGTPLLVDAVAVVRGAPNPELARQFVEFIGSNPALVPAARDFFRLPARTDFPADSLPERMRAVRAQISPSPSTGTGCSSRDPRGCATGTRTSATAARDERGALMAMEEIRVRTSRRSEMVEITGQVQELVARGGVREGAAVIQSLHTTAALTINENADPDVQHDLLGKLDRLVPHEEAYYRHAEGNSDSHLKTSFFGPSLTVIVSGGRLVLGRGRGSTCASSTARASGGWPCSCSPA